MPPVRISLLQGTSAHIGKTVGEIVPQAMRSAIARPAHDHVQVRTDYDHDRLISDSLSLGIERTDDFLLIQMPLNEGRTPRRLCIRRSQSGSMLSLAFGERMSSSTWSTSNKKTGHLATASPSMPNRRRFIDVI